MKRILSRLFGKRRPPESPGRAEVLQALCDMQDAVAHGRLLDWDVRTSVPMDVFSVTDGRAGTAVRYTVMVELFR